MTYAENRSWEAYQPFLPPALRCTGDRVPSEEYWTWRGDRIHLDRHRAEEAPVKLIALHGAGGNGRVLAPVGIAAGELAETVAPDLPGYGHSQLRRGNYTYSDWVNCVLDLVETEAKDGRPMVLFGASMGGMLAYDVAALSQDVRAVIATCLLDPADQDVRRAVVRHPALAKAIPLLLVLEPLLRRIRVPVRAVAKVQDIANDPALVRACLADPVGAGTSIPMSFPTSWLASERSVPPEDFDVPVLLVHPGDDRWTPPALSKAFLDRIRGHTVYVELPGCGHAPVEEPGLSIMRQAMLRFITEVCEVA